MYKILSLVFLLYLFSIGQDTVNNNQPKSVDKDNTFLLEFTDVVSVDGTDKKELYKRAILWFAECFKNSNEVIQVKDQEAGEIVGKGNFVYSHNTSIQACREGVINFTIKIYTKDGRYKYIISDFYHKAYNPSCSFGDLNTAEEREKYLTNKKHLNKLIKKTRQTIETTIINLKDFMNRATESQKDNW